MYIKVYIKVIKNLQTCLKIPKNILRTMVKTPAQTDGWFKSFIQKTAQKGFFLKMALFGQFFCYNFLTIHWFELGFSPLFMEYFSWFFRIFSECFEDFLFFTPYSKMAPKKIKIPPFQIHHRPKIKIVSTWHIKISMFKHFGTYTTNSN